MSRVNLTKKDLINSIYMQIGFSKSISENLIDDFLITIIDNLKNEKKSSIRFSEICFEKPSCI